MIYKIETEEDYLKGLKRFLELCGNQKTDEEFKEFELLVQLMEKYERNSCAGC